jgi:hypothetical protein
MSSEDLDAFSGSRPYECVRCGRRMRTRGIDGSCYACFDHPPVRCERCARVRFDPDTAWEDHPGTVPGEVAGTCRTCGDLLKAERAKQYARECRRTAARAAKGYGGPAEGEDVFGGFREG